MGNKISIAFLLTTSIISSPVLAQKEAGRVQGGLDDIIVTAQRRAEALQDVPISITAVGGDTLARSGVVESNQLTQVTPGLTMTQQNSSVFPFLRGIGSTNSAAGAENPVAFYVDGVYIVAPYSALLALNNVERIEVLRGPQGVSFGRNATGGLIRIITKDPQQDPEMKLGFTYGSYQTVTASAYLTGGLTEGISASIAAMTSAQGKGWGRNLHLDREIDKTTESALRGELLFEPAEGLSINVNADYSRRDSDIGLNRVAPPGTYYLDGVLGPENSRDSRAATPTFAIMTQYGGSVEIQYDFGDAQITSTTALRRARQHVLYDNEGTPLRFNDVYMRQRDRSFQQEVILTTEFGPVDFLVGAFYYKDRSIYDPNDGTSEMVPTLNVIRYANLGTRSLAGFAQATLAVTDTTNITAGIRYTDEHKTGFGYYIAKPGYPLPTGSIIPAFTTPEERKIKYSEPTFRLAIDQKLGEALMAYASFSRGFKAGGFNAINVTTDPVFPENLDAYEIGIKSEWFDRQLRLNLNGYYYDYTNIQLTQLSLGGFNLVNAAQARAHGIEVETLFQPHLPSGNLTIRAAGAYAGGEYRAFRDAAIYLPNPVTAVPEGVVCPATRPTTVGGNLTCTGDNSGKTLARMPKWTITAGVEYSIPVGGEDEISLSTDVYHSSSFFFDAANRFRNPAYTLLNAQIAYGINGDQLRLRVFGRNLTKARYYTFGAEGGIGDQAIRGAPRTFGIGLDASF